MHDQGYNSTLLLRLTTWPNLRDTPKHLERMLRYLDASGLNVRFLTISQILKLNE